MGTLFAIGACGTINPFYAYSARVGPARLHGNTSISLKANDTGEQMNAKAILSYAAEKEAKFVSVRFTDLPGAWHHLDVSDT